MPDYIRLHAVAYCTTVKVRSVCSFYNKHNIHDLQKKKKKSTMMWKRENKNWWISLTLESHLSFRNINLFIIFFSPGNNITLLCITSSGFFLSFFFFFPVYTVFVESAYDGAELRNQTLIIPASVNEANTNSTSECTHYHCFSSMP